MAEVVGWKLEWDEGEIKYIHNKIQKQIKVKKEEKSSKCWGKKKIFISLVKKTTNKNGSNHLWLPNALGYWIIWSIFDDHFLNFCNKKVIKII